LESTKRIFEPLG